MHKTKELFLFTSENAFLKENPKLSAITYGEGASMIKKFMLDAKATSCDLTSVTLCPLHPKHEEYIKQNTIELNTKVLNYEFQDKNLFREAPLTKKQIETIFKETKKLVQNSNAKTIGVGEIAGGNSTVAAIIYSYYFNLLAKEISGNGSGIDDELLQYKQNIIYNFVKKLKSQNLTQKEFVYRVATPEIISMCWTILTCIEEKKEIYIDGYIATSALILAQMLNNDAVHKVVYATLSSEKGHKHFFEHFKKTPIINVGLSYGAGLATLLTWELQNKLKGINK